MEFLSCSSVSFFKYIYIYAAVRGTDLGAEPPQLRAICRRDVNFLFYSLCFCLFFLTSHRVVRRINNMFTFTLREPCRVKKLPSVYVTHEKIIPLGNMNTVYYQ